jgi:hypothetical protein
MLISCYFVIFLVLDTPGAQSFDPKDRCLNESKAASGSMGSMGSSHGGSFSKRRQGPK